MSYFDDASLVMIPSGYKTSKVYSVKPTDGTGDLTFSRSNDTATRVGPDGLIEKVRTNLATNSEAFNLWLASDSTTTANAAANPLDGATTADKVIASATTAEHNVYYSVTSAVGEITTSVYAKADGYNFLYLRNTSSSGGGVWFNLSTGAVATQQSGRVGAITSVGNGWYRCSVTWNQPTAGTNQFIIVGPAPADNTATYLGDGTSDVLLFGAQMEYGVMTDYIPTTSAAVSVGPVANVPRLDYLNSSCPRLLLEPQRTNLLTNSENGTGTNWGNPYQVSVTANQTTSPDGYVNADSVADTANNTPHRFEPSFNATNGTVYTFSYFAKANTLTQCHIYGFTDNLVFSGQEAIFNLSNGTVVSNTGGGTAAITPYGNGWYRVSLTLTANATSLGYWGFGPAKNGAVGYLGNGSSLYMWGVQLEAGAYATSYIPTLGAAVTRGVDAASKTSASALIGQTEGTIFWETEFTTMVATGHEGVLNIDDGTFGDTIYLFKGSTGNFVAEMYIGGVQQASFSTSAKPIGTYKMALAYANNNTAFFLNGEQIGTTDTSCSIPATNRIQLGNGALGPSTDRTAQVLLFPTRLTNAQLAELTTL